MSESEARIGMQQYTRVITSLNVSPENLYTSIYSHNTMHVLK